MISDIVSQAFDFYIIVRGGNAHIISLLVDGILSEMLLSDNIPKHETNLLWSIAGILGVSRPNIFDAN